MSEEPALDAAMAVMECSFDPFWGEAWTRVQVRDALAMPATTLLLADREGRATPAGPAAGFVLSRQALDEEELLLLAVRPQERGRGLGLRMLESYFDAARRRGVRHVFLEMRANNPAHALYRRGGFVPIGTRPRYYRAADGQVIDAITFARHL
jgi:[ribosomal protein S18]-alanine N-acetyltransferase